MDDRDTCCCKKCKEKVEIFYFGKPLCNRHWNKFADKTPSELKDILGVKEKSSASVA